MFSEDFFCSQRAQEAGEQLFATATHTTTWLVLEYTGAWGNKALAESAIPVSVKEHLARLERQLPNARIQLIKQTAGAEAAGNEVMGDAASGLRASRQHVSPITFYVAFADEKKSSLYRFTLADYEQLLAFDEDLMARLAAHDAAHANSRVARPIYLVCTNGRRDRCCAKWGLPVYNAMASYGGNSVWQTSHTGGHRFAATAVCLPEGVMYGWLTPDDARPLIDAHRQRQLYRLDRYRGRSCYPSHLQAADYYLRLQTGDRHLASFVLAQDEGNAAQMWRVSFRSPTTQQHHTVSMHYGGSTVERPASCHKAPEPLSLYTFVDCVSF